MLSQAVVQSGPLEVTILKFLATPPCHCGERDHHPPDNQIDGVRDYPLVGYMIRQIKRNRKLGVAAINPQIELDFVSDRKGGGLEQIESVLPLPNTHREIAKPLVVKDRRPITACAGERDEPVIVRGKLVTCSGV